MIPLKSVQILHISIVKSIPIALFPEPEKNRFFFHLFSEGLIQIARRSNESEVRNGGCHLMSSSHIHVQARY